MTSGIYAITNTVTGERYIGSARNIERRWMVHRKALREGMHHSQQLQQAWNEQGITAFSWQVLEVVPVETLREREQHHIDIGRHEYNTATAHNALVPLSLTSSPEAKRMLREMGERWYPNLKRPDGTALERLIREAYAREIEQQGEGAKHA